VATAGGLLRHASVMQPRTAHQQLTAPCRQMQMRLGIAVARLSARYALAQDGLLSPELSTPLCSVAQAAILVCPSVLQVQHMHRNDHKQLGLRVYTAGWARLLRCFCGFRPAGSSLSALEGWTAVHERPRTFCGHSTRLQSWFAREIYSKHARSRSVPTSKSRDCIGGLQWQHSARGAVQDNLISHDTNSQSASIAIHTPCMHAQKRWSCKTGISHRCL
jgi:hypothetical protein